jgi:hypothetical protein
VHRRTLALLLVLLVGGTPQAIACVFACAEQTTPTAADDQHHDRHASHQSSSPVLDSEMAAPPHECGGSQQSPRMAEPASKAKTLQTIVASIISLDAPAQNALTLFSVVAQRPPGFRFLAAQLRT